MYFIKKIKAGGQLGGLMSLASAATLFKAFVFSSFLVIYLTAIKGSIGHGELAKVVCHSSSATLNFYKIRILHHTVSVQKI